MMKPNRRNWLKQIGLGLTAIGLAPLNIFASPKEDFLKTVPEDLIKQLSTNADNMKLGAFSISLSVKDINVSKQFYENLGFKVLGGDIKKNYFVMKNENALIGIFQGMFKGNILTFNPGWDENAKKVETFDDVRKIQQQLKGKGLKFESEADEKSSGPAGFFLLDPDGNSILIDQHV